METRVYSGSIYRKECISYCRINLGMCYIVYMYAAFEDLDHKMYKYDVVSYTTKTRITA